MKFGRRDDPAYYSRLREVLGASRRALLAGFTAIVLAGRGCCVERVGVHSSAHRIRVHGDRWVARLVDGAFNLGVILRERGDLNGAEAAYRRAEERKATPSASTRYFRI